MKFFYFLLFLDLFIRQSSSFQLVLLHSGDSRGNFLPVDSSREEECDYLEYDNKTQCIGGIARRAGLINKIRRENENVLLVDGGNVFTGTNFFFVFQGTLSAEMMNKLRYDAVGIGTHEFDLGQVTLYSNFLSNLNFSAASANLDLLDSPTLNRVIRPYVELTVSGEIIGFTSVVTQDLVIFSRAGQGVGVLDPVSRLRAVVEEMKRKNINKIVVSTVLNSLETEEIVSTVSGIDIVISGPGYNFPTTSRVNQAGEIVLYTSNGDLGRYLGIENVTFNAEGQIIDWDSTREVLTNEIAEDVSIRERVTEAAEFVAQQVNIVVGEVNCTVIGDSRCLREECEMGNLITDAFRFQNQKQIALMNAGGIRGNFTTGNITKGNIYSVLPFQNTISTFVISGLNLWKTILHGLSRVNEESGGGRFLQVSGMRFQFNPNASADRRLVSLDIETPTGTFIPVKFSANYTVVANSFIRRGGDAFDVLKEETWEVNDLGPPYEIDFIRYVDNLNYSFCPTLQQRIIITDTVGRTIEELLGSSTDTESKEGENDNVALIASLSVVLPLLLLGAIIGGLFYWKIKNKQPQQINSTSIVNRESGILPEYKLENVEIKDKIGKGNFGDVFKGTWSNSTVALKKLQDKQQLQAVWEEVSILQSINHPHIVRYFGTFTSEDKSVYIVMEYVELGSLEEYINTENHKLSVYDLKVMALQIIAGMKYLEERNIIHRDLALRNILIAEEVTKDKRKFILKIADFGMSKAQEIYQLNQNEVQPLRWTAPEALRERHFTSKSDIWSMGVVMWELFSFGSYPYGNMKTEDILPALLKDIRLPQPSQCPDDVYKLMLECWKLDPNDRPTFAKLFDLVCNLKLETSSVVLEGAKPHVSPFEPSDSMFYTT